MPQVGDRVIVAGQKLGAPTREGTLLAKIGTMIRVRWSDGAESLFTPGAGSVEFQAAPKGSASRGSRNGKSASKASGKAAPNTAKASSSKGAKAPAKASKAAGAKGTAGKAVKKKKAPSKTAKKSARRT